MRTGGQDRVPRATPAAGSGAQGQGRAPRVQRPSAPRGGLHLDGRVARGQQTRRLLAETLVGLVDAGTAAPTIRQVAAGAGVSVRAVFHHFGGTEGLVVAALSLQSERHRDVLFAIPPRGPPDLRVRALCRQRRLYFEEMTPVYRLALARVHARVDTGAGLAELLAEDRTRLRRQLTGTLAPEVGTRGAHSDVLLDALEQSTGWEAWRALRDVWHLTPAAAERAMAFTAGRLLG